MNLQRISNKREYEEFLLLDRLANSYNSKGIKNKLKYIFYPNPIESFLRLLRKYEYLNNIKNKNIFQWVSCFIVRINYRRLSLKLGFSIPINVFGLGLSIPHYGTIVVSKFARIDSNCRIHVGVNIGASAGEAKAPQLGDNTYIGPGAIIFGDIYIGNNNTIAANATVNKPCSESNNVLAGTPAKIVKKDYPVWWENNKISL